MKSAFGRIRTRGSLRHLRFDTRRTLGHHVRTLLEFRDTVNKFVGRIQVFVARMTQSLMPQDTLRFDTNIVDRNGLKNNFLKRCSGKGGLEGSLRSNIKIGILATSEVLGDGCSRTKQGPVGDQSNWKYGPDGSLHQLQEVVLVRQQGPAKTLFGERK